MFDARSVILFNRASRQMSVAQKKASQGDTLTAMRYVRLAEANVLKARSSMPRGRKRRSTPDASLSANIRAAIKRTAIDTLLGG